VINRFGGAMVARAGAGPLPIPYKQLTADKLAAALTEALKPETLTKAQELGAKIKEENGCEVGGKAFHDMLDVDNLRCTLAPSRVAVWRVKRTQTRLSALAATVLAQEGLLNFADLKLYRPREYETEDGPWDPITGGASALLGTIASLSMGVADFPIEIFRTIKNKSQSSKDSGSSTTGTSSTAGTNTPTPTERSGTSTDFSRTSGETSESFEAPDSATSTKSSYENTDRSSTEDKSVPDTPLSSTSSHGERGNSFKASLERNTIAIKVSIQRTWVLPVQLDITSWIEK
jgi:hypothetical protein